MLLLLNKIVFKVFIKFGLKKIWFEILNICCQQRFTKADDIGQFTIKEFDITR